MHRERDTAAQSDPGPGAALLAELACPAGFETTTGLLANGLVALLGHPDRDESGVLSFGAGIYHCLGAALARLEGQVMLPAERRPGISIHSSTTLPVALGRARVG